MGGFKPIVWPDFIKRTLLGVGMGYALAIGISLRTNATPFQGLIYGEVTLNNGQLQKGILVWSSRQLFWEDIFDAQREENNALDFLNPDEIKGLSDQEIKDKIEWGFMHVWENKIPAKSQKFSCRFGDISSLTVLDEKSALLYFKNGSSMKVRAGNRYNDVGNRIYVIDSSGKWNRIEWGNMKRIEYMPTPSNALTSPVRPLYGTVKTETSELTGYIKWDQDESMTSFRLSGKMDGQRKRISFGEISKIKKIAINSCEVTLDSKEQVILSDNDDVGPNNHGLTVFVRNTGNVVVEWKDFREVTFYPNQQDSELMGYLDFILSKPLWGKIKTTDGMVHKGKFIYDLDEQWDFETLEGTTGDLHYSIALRDIRVIERRNPKYTFLLLKNGQKLLLTGHHDVTAKNWGILVWKGDNIPKYLPWNSVHSIYLP